MLRNWEISPEAARYLEIGNKVKSSGVNDLTCPQLCLMVYSPNVYQQMIDHIAEAEEMGMDIEAEGVEVR